MKQSSFKTIAIISGLLLVSLSFLRSRYHQFPSSASVNAGTQSDSLTEVALFAAQNQSLNAGRPITAPRPNLRAPKRLRYQAHQALSSGLSQNLANEITPDIDDSETTTPDSEPIKATSKSKSEKVVDLEFDEEGNIIIKDEDKALDDEEVAEAEHDNDEDSSEKEAANDEEEKSETTETDELIAGQPDLQPPPKDSAGQNVALNNAPVFFDPRSLLPPPSNAGERLDNEEGEGEDSADQIDGKDLADFTKDFLEQPTEQSTLLLVNRYQSGEITAANFYKIVEDIVQDSRPEVKRLGLLALGSTPSTESFVRLVRLQQEPEFGNELLAQAQTYINQYSGLGLLPALEPILTGEGFSVFTFVVTLERIDEALLLQRTEPTPGIENPDEIRLAQFQRFAQLLEAAVKSGLEPSTLPLAQQTLLNLQAAL